MNPEDVAIPLIEAMASKYSLMWKNTGRVSASWKAKVYEQTTTGLQLAIYDRNITIIRLEYPVLGISGVRQLYACPKSGALNVELSHFKNGNGVCVAVSDTVALEHLLKYYFAPDALPETLEHADLEFEKELADARLRTSDERRQRLALVHKSADGAILCGPSSLKRE